MEEGVLDRETEAPGGGRGGLSGWNSRPALPLAL